MKDRLLEICEKILEIKAESENYVGLYESGKYNPNRKEVKFYLMKDGATHASLYDLEYEDYLLLQDARMLNGNISAPYQEYAIFDIDCYKALKYIEEQSIKKYEEYLNKGTK